MMYKLWLYILINKIIIIHIFLFNSQKYEMKFLRMHVYECGECILPVWKYKNEFFYLMEVTLGDKVAKKTLEELESIDE